MGWGGGVSTCLTVDSIPVLVCQVDYLNLFLSFALLVPCNAPGGILEYMEYVKEGHFVPAPILDPEVGIEYELFAEKRTFSGDQSSSAVSSLARRNNKGQTIKRP